MKKGLVAAAVLLLAAGGAAAGWYYYNDQSWNLEYFQNLFEEEKRSVYVTDIATLMGRSSTVADRYAGVVEPQSTVSVQLESGRRVSEVKVKEGDTVKQGQLLFEYDLSSIERSLQTAQLDLERLQSDAINYQNSIASLEKEKKKAKAENQLSYTIEIETNRMNLKKNEYDQKSKQAEIERLTNATTNTEVRSDIDGIIQKIDTSKISTGEEDDTISSSLEESYGGYDDGSGNNNAFITILSTGAYRVKGKVNELNRDQIIPGEPVIIRSRVDEDVTWRGTMGYIDTQSDNSNNTDSMYGGYGTDTQTSSTTYPFYVELNSSEGLMLGQHVYIEMDIGQDTQKEGLWLLEDYIADADTEEPFVWMAGSGNKLVKQKITVGEYDPYQMQYEILDGVTEDDYIAFPTDQLEEGMITVIGSIDQTRNSMLYMEEESGDEEVTEDGEYDESFLKSDDSESWSDSDSEQTVDDGDYEYEDITEIDGESLDSENLGSDSILDGEVFVEEPEVVEGTMDDGNSAENEDNQSTDSEAFPDDLMPVE